MARLRNRLGNVQLQVLKVLWRRGAATAREITDELSETVPMALSTVQTLLRQLEAKGAVFHTHEERAFVFQPVWEETEVAQGAARDLLDRVFEGSAFGMVSYLLRNERISPEELRQLRELIDEKGGE